MTRKKLAATANRREGVYNRTGKPSVTFCERGGARKWAEVLFSVADKINIPPQSGGYFRFGHSPKLYWLRTSAFLVGLPAAHWITCYP